jgi:hypothetical protein
VKGAISASFVLVGASCLFLEGGLGWWKQITDAIDSVEFLVLVMTPAAMASGIVQKEWRYARQQGVCVYPVKGQEDEILTDHQQLTAIQILEKKLGFGGQVLSVACPQCWHLKRGSSSRKR